MFIDKFREANQLLNACGWRTARLPYNGKKAYFVYDKMDVLVRTFVPVERLLDYARGVFDAQEWDK